MQGFSTFLEDGFDNQFYAALSKAIEEVSTRLLAARGKTAESEPRRTMWTDLGNYWEPTSSLRDNVFDGQENVLNALNWRDLAETRFLVENDGKLPDTPELGRWASPLLFQPALLSSRFP